MERLQKVLAQAGIASRRAAEEIILAGRVRVDGKIVRELGTQVDPRTSRVEVDGNKIVAEKLIYIVLHKPRGVVCTLSDPEGRPTILELLKDAGARVVPVGRLDFHTSGALLCTNDGEFAQALAHPKKAVPKVYVAKVKGAVDDAALERFSERIVIDGRPTQPAQVKRLRFEGDKTWLEITLREGRNRQVRRLGEATGFPVMRLARISHAGVTSEDLRPGQWRPLSLDELVELKRDYGVPKKVRAPIFEPALGKGGWSDEPRTPGARRPEPKFSAARRRDAKPADAARASAKRGGHQRFEASNAEPSRFERKRGPRADAAPPAAGPGFDRRRTAPRGEEGPPRFDRKRTAPRGEQPPRVAGPGFDRKRTAPRGEEGPQRFDRKRSAPRGEEAPQRFDRKRTAPGGEAAPRAAGQGFDRKRTPPRGEEAPPRFDRKRTAPRGEAAPRAAGQGFDRKRTPPRGEQAPKRFATSTPAVAPKPFSAKHREQKRFKAKNAEPEPFAAARSSSKTPSRSDARGSGPRRGTSR